MSRRTLLYFTVLPYLCLYSFSSSAKRHTTIHQGKDTFNIASHTLHFPGKIDPGKFRIGAGLIFVTPPEDITEYALQSPMIYVHAATGLPWLFTFETSLTSIIVSDQITFGPHFNWVHGSFGLKVGWDFAWIYGQFRPSGFDNVTKGWLFYPTISIGYRTRDLAFTLKAEDVIISLLTQINGKNKLVSETNSQNGLTLAFYIEQRLWKNNILSIGLKDNYLKYYWPTWMLYSTFNRYYHIPEFSLILVF